MIRLMRLAAMLAALCLPAAAQAYPLIYTVQGLDNTSQVPVEPYAQVNPNNGTPCYVGNTGCPGLPSSGASAPAVAYSGQQKTTLTAAALPSQTSANGWVIKAASSNTGVVCVGGAGVTATNDGTGNGYCLAPGEPISYATANLNNLYIVGPNTTNFVYYAGN